MKASDWLNDTRHGIARSIRPGQVAMASLVEGILENGGIGFLEAGTGTGKSFAYAIPAILSGKRVVIFSGGEAKDTASVLEEIRQINAGGGFGSIMGRNAFQRPREEALKLLGDVMDIYASK